MKGEALEGRAKAVSEKFTLFPSFLFLPSSLLSQQLPEMEVGLGEKGGILQLSNGFLSCEEILSSY